MTLTASDHYAWDFWLAPRRSEAEPYHLFYLRAPRSLADPEDRHNLAIIGHATSPDLRDWTILPPALQPCETGSWDDFTTWTGSVVDDDERYWMFYTGRNRAERGRIQRIGAAVSNDLSTWTKVGVDPLLETNGSWYESANTTTGPVACRDPWLFREADHWLMYFTASEPGIPRDRNGVIGLARSSDLLHWELEPPVVAPRQFGELEVPQLVQRDGRCYLFFCTGKHANTSNRRWIGTHYYVGNDLGGPFEIGAPEPLAGDELGSWYAGRVVDGETDHPLFMAFHRTTTGHDFPGEISDPVRMSFGSPVTLDGRGLS